MLRRIYRYYLGHAFVIDGYDSNGRPISRVGLEGGYYDMSSLGSYVYGQSAMIFYPLGRPGQMQSWMVCSEVWVLQKAM